MRKKCELLEDRLDQMAAPEIESFASRFTDCYYKAYNWDVWGAAYVTFGGCSSDGFMDFVPPWSRSFELRSKLP